MRINKASDDAAGLSISSDLQSQARFKKQSVRNLNDAISAISIYNEALSQLSNITTRLYEISNQSANGTLTTRQRSAIAKEHSSLVSEFNRIIDTTSFNGIKLGNIIEQAVEMNIGGEIFEINFGKELARTVSDGTYQDPTFSGGDSVIKFALGDTNNDGIKEIYSLSGGSNDIEVRYIYQDGTISAPSIFQSGSYSNISIGDLNGDRFLDIAFSNSVSTQIFSGNENGLPILSDAFSLNLNKSKITEGMNSAILFAGFNPVNQVFLNQYNSIAGLKPIQGSYSVYSFSTGDFNSDGILDYVYYNESTFDVILQYGSNSGIGQNLIISAGEDSVYNTYSLDFDADGLLDIGFYNEQSFEFKVAFQNKDGTFNAPQVVLSAPSMNVAAGDINQDGFIDLISGNDTELRTYIQSSPRQFEFVGSTTSLEAGLDNFTLVDVNGDSALDIISNAVEGAVGEGLAIFIANTTKTNKIGYQNLTTKSGSLLAMDEAQKTLERINLEQAYMGAVESRLNFAIKNYQTEILNYQEGASRIQDADIALESAELIKSQIVQNFAAKVIKESNLQAEIVLKLLRDT